MCLVLLLYASIYKAVYQRRVNRAKKLSTYQKILRSDHSSAVTAVRKRLIHVRRWLVAFIIEPIPLSLRLPVRFRKKRRPEAVLVNTSSWN